MTEQIKQNRQPERDVAIQELQKDGGFATIILPLAEHLKYFSSAKEANNRAMFLEEEDFAPARKKLKSNVDTLIRILAKAESIDAMKAQAQKEVKEISDVKKKNIEKIVEKIKPIERSWRELDLFYSNASSGKVENVTMMNVNREDYIDKEVPMIKDAIRDILYDADKALDQDKVYSMLVMPGFLGEELISDYASIANDNNVLFLSDYKDGDSVADVLEYRKNKGEKIGGIEKKWSHAVLFSNYVQMREKYNFEEEAMYGSPCVSVAGKLYATRISQPAAGVEFGGMDKTLGLKFNVLQPHVGLMGNEGINAVVNAFQKNMPFNCVTLFNGKNVELRQYAVVRTFDYIDKMLKHFLNQCVHTSMHEGERRQRVHRSVLKFLKDLEDNKIIAKGTITKFENNDDEPDRFDIDFAIKPLFATRAFVYKVGVDKTKATSDLSAE